MRKLLLLVFLMIPLMLLRAMDDGKVKVKLKTGTTIIGDLKILDPLHKVVISIAEQETTIPMSEIENIEMLQDNPSTSQNNKMVPDYQNQNQELGDKKLIVTETRSYPERITLKIGDYPVEMILIPGGQMNMGYDGRGSLSMKSEPIHKVSVTSFYLSSQPLPASYVSSILGSKVINGEGADPAEVPKFKYVESLLSEISQQSGKKLRLPTEAEWEFAACSNQQHIIFDIAKGSKVAYEWCSDFWDEFKNSNGIIDPQGPSSGHQHVVRAYNAIRGKFDRSNEVEGKHYQGLIRLAIKAIDIE